MGYWETPSPVTASIPPPSAVKPAGRWWRSGLKPWTAIAPPATNRFPSDAPARECLVRYGEDQPPGSFGTYRIWMTLAVSNLWTTRHKLHNSPLDITFAYGNARAIYNGGAKYAGASGSCEYDHPTGVDCGYALEWPGDDAFLGAREGTLDWSKFDTTEQKEQTAYWMANEVGLPYNHRRFVHLYVNGVRRGTIYEDTQQPSQDFLDEWYPSNPKGDLFKLEIWWKNCQPGCYESCSGYFPTLLERHLRPTPQGTVFNVARYRWNWLKRADQGRPNDYGALSNLVEAVNTPLGSAYTAALDAEIDTEQWMRLLAFSHAVANVDSWGYLTGHNLYAFKPGGGKWLLQLFDIEFVFGEGSYAASDTDLFFWINNDRDWRITQMWSHPPFRRAYWRGLRETALGLMDAAKIDPTMDATWAALRSNGVPSAEEPIAAKNWIAERRAYILSGLSEVSPAFAVTNNNGQGFSTSQNPVPLGGTAPIEVKFIRIHDRETNELVTWTSVTNWSMNVVLANGSNYLVIEGWDRLTNFIPGMTNGITVTNEP